MVGSTPLSVSHDYRCYLLGSDNRIKDVVEFASPSDEEAIAIAQRYLSQLKYYAGVELWEGLRQVYVRPPPQPDET
jgi:hypothetical protein